MGRCQREERHVFDNLGAGIFPFAFSPDGKVLASVDNLRGGQDLLVRLLDTTTGKELCRRIGSHGIGSRGVFARRKAGRIRRATKEEENFFIEVWEAATGRLIRRFEGHHSGVGAVRFSADGLTVASGAWRFHHSVVGHHRPAPDGRWHAKPLTPRELDARWAALANVDAAKAYDAVWVIVAAPEQAVSFLRNHLLAGSASRC